MPHRNAPLTETGRLRLARCVVEYGWPLRRAAERFQVATSTAHRWAGRYRQLGEAGMTDRSSRPHHSPHRTPTRLERRIIKVRVARRWGPARIGYLLGVHPSTVHRVLTRYHLARLRDLDRATGRTVRRPVRRYEHPAPGDLVHVDIKKLGNIPDGGGHKAHGRAVGGRHASAHRDPTRPRKVSNHPNLGYGYLHNAVDDHSRLAYTEILPDEKGHTCAGFLRRAATYFHSRGIIRIERVMTDNAWAYRYSLRDVCANLDARQVFIRPHCPWQNGKVERLNRTLQTEWAYRQVFTTNDERAAALAPWIENYNTRRRHSALGGLPPISRLQPT